jgi:IS605 OrfB family transposase
MEIQRTITILLPNDDDLRATVRAFQSVQNLLSPLCFNEGNLLRAQALQRAHYLAVKGAVSSQMTITAMRLVSGAYASARAGYRRRLAREAKRQARCAQKGKKYTPRPVKEPGLCQFTRASAMFLVGSRGRDAAFLPDGMLSIWTTAGRKHLPYTIPVALQQTFDEAVEIDSLTVIERQGRLLGRVVVTLSVLEPSGSNPVGIDRNETNALVAVDADDRQRFISGKAHTISNKRSRQTRQRLQAKLASRKAQTQDTHSVRRLLQRHGRKHRNRNRTFCQAVAKELCAWAPPNAVLVLEDLSIPPPQRGTIRGTGLRRRLSGWFHGQMLQAIRSRAERIGMAVGLVNPAYTSQTCHHCGLLGVRKRHRFTCPSCGHHAHADVNAARNIRDRFVVSTHDGGLSVSPEALDISVSEGKPTTSVVGS